MSYHEPVLLKESIEGLDIKKNGIYIDATFGGGGHSKVILNNISAKGYLYAFDQDEDALQNAIDSPQFILTKCNFRHINKFLKFYGVKSVDGILADLGVSSYQFETAERGFSYRFDAILDMRMNKDSKWDAARVLNEYDSSKLVNMFSAYGEVRNAKTLVSKIMESRARAKIKTIGDLLDILEEIRIGNPKRYFAQVFQALRMEVNDEERVLKEFLENSIRVLKENGRIVMISYHSIEDRIVKRAFRQIRFSESTVDNMCEWKYRAVNKKIITPAREELINNPRSRSAKLRIAEKIKV